jgi:hypothetical protein
MYRSFCLGVERFLWSQRRNTELRLFEIEVQNTVPAPMGAARIIYIERGWQHPENLLLSCLRIFLRIALEFCVSI